MTRNKGHWQYLIILASSLSACMIIKIFACKCVGWFSIILDIAIGVFASGLVAYLIFLQEKKRQLACLKNNHGLIKGILSKYVSLITRIITPVHSLESSQPSADILSKDFTIADMKGMFESSFIVGESSSETTLEQFLRIEDRLVDCLRIFLSLNNLDFFTDVRDCFIEFVRISSKENCGSAILNSEKDYRGLAFDERVKVYIELMENGSMDHLQREYKRGMDINDNIAAPIVYFYNMLEGEMSQLRVYQDFLRRNGLTLID